MRSLRDESGFTLPELLVYMVLLSILLAALAMIFSLGLTSSKTASAQEAGQSGVVIALDRLDYDVRCASSATLLSGGTGATLTFPSQCPHTTGTVTWCVTGGSLVSFSGAACSGTGQTLLTNVTTTTPFSCAAPVGSYPALKVALTVNTGTSTTTAYSGSDFITLENAVLTTSNYTGCS
jgi:prepilin-type N-terminal cleavage/methylation domain-containing protein